MNENKKYSINNMLLAFITFLGVVGLVALTGFFLLTPPDDIIMGQFREKFPDESKHIVSVRATR